MACQAIGITEYGSSGQRGGLLCTTSEHIFGPLFPSSSAATHFIEWLDGLGGRDPRSLTHEELEDSADQWSSLFCCDGCGDMINKDWNRRAECGECGAQICETCNCGATATPICRVCQEAYVKQVLLKRRQARESRERGDK